MPKFKVEITETLQKQIEIEAETSVEAIRLAKQKYRNSEIVLSADDYIDTEIRAIPSCRSKNRNER